MIALDFLPGYFYAHLFVALEPLILEKRYTTQPYLFSTFILISAKKFACHLLVFGAGAPENKCAKQFFEDDKCTFLFGEGLQIEAC